MKCKLNSEKELIELSIVTTIYKSEKYISEFYRRTLKVAQKYFNNIEIIFVNDGSPDRSSSIVRSLCRDDYRIKLIELSRNFGHHKAIMTGLSYAKGDLIWLIDSDLEEEPEWLIDFYEKFRNNDVDLVFGVQKKRRGNIFDRIAGKIYFSFINSISSIKLQEKGMTTSSLMTANYKNSLCEYKEQNVVLSGLFALTGFRQIPCEVNKKNNSPSTYNFLIKMRLIFDTITSLSAFPLVITFYLGISIFFFSVIYTMYVIYGWLTQSSPVPGWTSVMVSIWMIGGILIAILGLIGIYISRIFIETKRRPYTTIREIYSINKDI